MGDGIDLEGFPVHLGRGGRIVELSGFGEDPDFYANYERESADDGLEGWLVSQHAFERSWDSWEMHPEGHELVVCVAGRLRLHQERDGVVREVVLEAGERAINPPGTWHTADVLDDAGATCLFVTCGRGTQVRERAGS